MWRVLQRHDVRRRRPVLAARPRVRRAGYRTIPFPFERLAAPSLTLRADVDVRAGRRLHAVVVGDGAVHRGERTRSGRSTRSARWRRRGATRASRGRSSGRSRSSRALLLDSARVNVRWMSAATVDPVHVPVRAAAPMALPAIARRLAALLPDSRSTDGEAPLELTSERRAAAAPGRRAGHRRRRAGGEARVRCAGSSDSPRFSTARRRLASRAISPAAFRSSRARRRGRFASGANLRMFTWRHTIERRVYAPRALIDGDAWTRLASSELAVVDSTRARRCRRRCCRGTSAGASRDGGAPRAARSRGGGGGAGDRLVPLATRGRC